MKEKVAWSVFFEALVAQVGTKRINSIFCEQTGYSASSFYSWKRLGVVPKDAFEKIQYIKVDAIDDKRFKGYHTKSFFDRVVYLSNRKVPIADMAIILTSEMGRKITEGAIKSARYRMKDRIGHYHPKDI